MTAPDAQPPAELWWSNDRGAIKRYDGRVPAPFGEPPYVDAYGEFIDLPADAVRLVALVQECASVLDDPDGVTAYVCTKTARHTGTTRGDCHDDGDGTQWWGGDESVIRPAATDGAVSAALAGTTTPTAEAEVIKAASEFVRHTEMAIDAGWSGLGRPVFPYCELRAAVALLASTPTEETNR